MPSLGPIDKTRESIVIRLRRISQLVLDQQDCPPSVTAVDNSFAEINTIHPNLYQDLLKPWRPYPIFEGTSVVADGFNYPELEDTPPDESNRRYPEFLDAIDALIADIPYYLSGKWTKAYKELIEAYVVLRNGWITPETELREMKVYAQLTLGDEYKLLDYFEPWLHPHRMTVKHPATWAETLPEIEKATTTRRLLYVIRNYLLTQVLFANQKYKPIREVNMPVSVADFGNEIDEYLNDQPPTINAIAYCGSVAYVYGINLLANESGARGQYMHLLSKTISKHDQVSSFEERKNTLSVLTGPLSISFLFTAAARNLPTLILVTG